MTLAKIGNHELLNEFRTVHNNHRQTGHKGIVTPNGARGLVSSCNLKSGITGDNSPA